MMSAYFPEFAGIDPAVVCSWIFELEADLTRRANSTNGDCQRMPFNNIFNNKTINHDFCLISDSDGDGEVERLTLALQSLNEMLPTIAPR